MIRKILAKLPISNLKEHDSKYKFNCLICDDTSRRGNLYKESYLYHCYNCGYHKTIIELAEDFNINLDYKDYEALALNINKRNLFRLTRSTINYLFSKAINIDIFKKRYRLIEVYEDKRALRFIKSNILDFKIDRFLYDDRNKYIYFLNSIDNKVIGYCILNLRNFGKPEQFNTLNDIYNTLNISNQIPPAINNLTTHFNIMGLDLNKPITIFDDIVNSIFYENGLYVINHYRFYDNYKPGYFYANNQHGINRSLEKRESNYNVFNWRLFFKKKGITNKIYDLHDLRKFEKKTKKEFNLINFFN